MRKGNREHIEKTGIATSQISLTFHCISMP